MVGIRLMEQDHFNGAHEAYEHAIDSCHPDHAPSAWVMMGMLFERQGKPADARGAYLSIAELYLAEGAVPKARQLLQQAAAAGSTVAAHSTQMFAPDAILSASKRSSLAVLKSAQRGDTDSMNLLGLHAAMHGDLVEARSWWTKSARQRDVIAPLLHSRHLH